MYLRNGDLAQGMALVQELNQKQVYRDCAEILKVMLARRISICMQYIALVKERAG